MAEQNEKPVPTAKAFFTKAFGKQVAGALHEMERALNEPFCNVKFWKAAAIGFYIGKGLTPTAAVEYANEQFRLMDPLEVAKSAKWTGPMRNEKGTQFFLFRDGIVERELTVQEYDEMLKTLNNQATLPDTI